MAAARYDSLTLYRRLLALARPYWPHLAGLLVVSLLATPAALLTPLPVKIVVDSVLGSKPLPAVLAALLPASLSHSGGAILILAALLVVAVALLNQLQGLGGWLLGTYTGERLILRLRSELFAHVQRLSLSYHDAKGPADSAYRIQYDAPAIQWILINGVIPFLTAGLTVVGMIVVTLRLDWQLGVVALVVAPAVLLVTRAGSPRLRRWWHEVKELETSALSVVQEVLSAVRVVKAFGGEARERDRFERYSSQGMRGQLRVAFWKGGYDLLVGVTVAAGVAVTLLLGALHVQSGRLTLGELLIVMAYLAQLYEPLAAISAKAADIQSSLASADRCLSLLDEAPEIVERADARPLARAAGAVAFHDVSFAYGTGRLAVQNVSFEVRPGARVGIAGPTGAGKTTLASLLIRFYDPTAGSVTLDGVDLKDYRLADLRDQFGFVLQEPVLFSTTIAENIAYARPGASRGEIEAAAKAANADEFIASLSEGYETRVGERGMRLSGGERQRISLARAFLKNAPVLILDEPTSSVDPATEARILEAMERLMRGRTTFIIAHRASTLERCDDLLILENGRLVTSSAATAGR